MKALLKLSVFIVQLLLCFLLFSGCLAGQIAQANGVVVGAEGVSRLRPSRSYIVFLGGDIHTPAVAFSPVHDGPTYPQEATLRVSELTRILHEAVLPARFVISDPNGINRIFYTSLDDLKHSSRQFSITETSAFGDISSALEMLSIGTESDLSFELLPDISNTPSRGWNFVSQVFAPVVLLRQSTPESIKDNEQRFISLVANIERVLRETSFYDVVHSAGLPSPRPPLLSITSVSSVDDCINYMEKTLFPYMILPKGKVEIHESYSFFVITFSEPIPPDLLSSRFR